MLTTISSQTLQQAPLNTSASAPFPGPSSSAVATGGDTRTGGRRRRKRCKKNKTKNSDGANSHLIPHADADDIDIDIELVAASARYEDTDQVGSVTDTDGELAPPRQKRIHRGRNRGRGPRIRQPALVGDDAVNWAMA